MLLQNLFTKALRDRWLALVIATASVIGVTWMGIAAYSGISEGGNPIAFLPRIILDIYGISAGLSTVPLMMSTMGHLMVPLVVCGILIAAGAAAGAGEEAGGTVGLVLANPIGRTRMYAQKAAAVVVIAIVAALLMWGGYYV